MEDPKLIFDTIKKVKNDFDNLKSDNSDMGEIRKTLGKRYPNMADNYPAIFELAFKPDKEWNSDIQKLETMVNMASKVKNNEISQHDASVKIGTELVDKYVKPQLEGKS